jgi:7-cyano-7-deazaguanine synthase
VPAVWGDLHRESVRLVQDSWEVRVMDNVVLLSGGMDSAVMLSTAREVGSSVALTFDYGQTNRKELDAAKRLAEHYEASQRVVKVDFSFARGACAALGGDDISHTFVPARNLLFLSYGVALAESCGAHSVWFGANKDDHEYYPDTRPAFARVMSLAAELGTQHGGIQIIAPFMRMTKREVAELGQRKMVPLSWTTTCAISDPPCGGCRGCKQREACGV